MKKYAISDTIQGREVRAARRRLRLTQAEFAELVHVSKKTIERWESGVKEITGPIIPLIHFINEHPQLKEELIIPPKKYPLRLWYMDENHVSTIIDVDDCQHLLLQLPSIIVKLQVFPPKVELLFP